MKASKMDRPRQLRRATMRRIAPTTRAEGAQPHPEVIGAEDGCGAGPRRRGSLRSATLGDRQGEALADSDRPHRPGKTGKTDCPSASIADAGRVGKPPRRHFGKAYFAGTTGPS